jgi:hypothetical protein
MLIEMRMNTQSLKQRKVLLCSSGVVQNEISSTAGYLSSYSLLPHEGDGNAETKENVRIASGRIAGNFK